MNTQSIVYLTHDIVTQDVTLMNDCLLHRSATVVGIKATWVLGDVSGLTRNS